MKKYILPFLSLFIISFSSAFGKTYYVSTKGHDNNPGTSGLPFKNIQRGVNVAVAGDTVLVKEGTYCEKVNFPNSGTPGNPIVLAGLGRVAITGSAEVVRWTGIINIVKKYHIVVRDIRLVNSYWFGVYINLGSDYIWINNCRTYNTGASGIYAASSAHIYIDSNVVRKACYQSLSTTASQECITLSKVNHFRVADNEIFEPGFSTNGGEGLNAKNGCTNGKIARNNIHDLETLAIYVDAYDSYCRNIEVYSNRTYNCENGIVLACEQGGTLRDVKIYNNVSYKNKAHGIIVSSFVNNGPKYNIQIYNNTCYKNGANKWGGGITVEKDAGDSITIANNICYNNLVWGISVPDNIVCTVTHNLIYPLNNYFWISEVTGSNAIIAEPQFSDTLRHNFTLLPGSPAVKKGTATYAPKFDITGRAISSCCVDMGAYKLGSRTLRIESSGYYNQQNIQADDFVSVLNNRETGTIDIELKKPSPTPVSAAVYNLNGEIVSEKVSEGGRISVDMKNSPSGLYIVETVCGTQRNTRKLLID